MEKGKRGTPFFCEIRDKMSQQEENVFLGPVEKSGRVWKAMKAGVGWGGKSPTGGGLKHGEIKGHNGQKIKKMKTPQVREPPTPKFCCG